MGGAYERTLTLILLCGHTSAVKHLAPAVRAMLMPCRGVPKAAEKGLHQPSNDADFICPITGQGFNGR